MLDPTDATPQASRREPWNKGKLIGAKPPLRPKHVWSIRTKLQIAGRTRDLAMFNLAIDSKLRGCDVVSLRVEDVAPHGLAVDRATVRQKKTGQPVKFEMTEQTRESIDNYLATARKSPANFSSAAVAGGIDLSRRDSMPDWSANGLPASVWTRGSLGRTHCAEPKRPSFTAGLATCGQFSFCWDTRKLRARCATWGLRSTTLWP
jgi:hypothetical protein